MRGLTIDLDTVTELNTTAIKGAGIERGLEINWYIRNNHKMKYEINSKIPKDWDVGNLGKLLSNIKEQIFNRILAHVDYMMGQHNLLRNDGIVEYDQKSYSDYPIVIKHVSHY